MNDEPTTTGTGMPCETQGFEAVVEQYETPLLRYAARIVLDPIAAQDIVQNTFIKLSLNWNNGAIQPSDLAAWLYRVAHNCAVDHIRRECRRHTFMKRHAEESETLASDGQRSSDISGAAERASQMLKTLTLREQQAVILKVYEQKSYREIALITGLSESNVGYILHYAMKKLAASLQKTGGTKETSGDEPGQNQ